MKEQILEVMFLRGVMCNDPLHDLAEYLSEEPTKEDIEWAESKEVEVLAIVEEALAKIKLLAK